MHALVQACTRAWFEESGDKDYFRKHFIGCLGMFHPDPRFEFWTSCGELSPHVESLLNLPGLDDPDEDEAPYLLRVLSCAGNYNTETGRLERARILLTKALDVAEEISCPGHDYIIQAVTDLWKLRILFSKHHSVQTKITGATTRLYASLLGILMDPANNNAALQSYGLSVEDIHHDDQLTSEHKEALSLFHELRDLGRDVPKGSGYHIVRFIHDAPPCAFTSVMIGILALLIQTLGFVAKHAEKETTCRAILHRRIQFPDEDWLGETGWPEEEIWIALGRALGDQGKNEEVRYLLEQRQTQLEMQNAGGPSRCYLYARAALIRLLMKQGKWEDAEKSCRELLEYYKRKFGSRDPFLIELRMFIVVFHIKQDKHMEAVEELGHIVALCKMLLGFQHPGTLKAIVLLGNSLNKLRRYVQAEELLHGCLATLDKNHEDKIESSTYCMAVVTLSASFEAQGKIESESPEFLRQILDAVQTYLDETASDLDEDENIEEDESPAELSPTKGTARTLAPALPNMISQGAAISDLVHNYDNTDVAYQDNLQDWEENAAARAVEQLHAGGRMVGRNDTSRPEMKRLFAIGLGKRMSLHVERALGDFVSLLKGVKEGEVLDKDRNDVRGDEDEVEEDVE